MQHMKSKVENEHEIDLSRIGRILLKRVWLIVVVAIFIGLAGYIYSAVFIPPSYQSYFTAYVNNRLSSDTGLHTSTSDLTASMGLVYVYQDIITSRSVLASAAEACGTSYAEVYGSVTAYVSDNAPVVRVTVTTKSAKLSWQLAQKIAELAPGKVAEVVDGSSMRIIDEPVKPAKPAGPNSMRFAMICLLIGAILTMVVCVVLDLVYDNVQSSDEIERRYSVPVIGQIPDMHQAEKSGERYGYRRVGAEQR